MFCFQIVQIKYIFNCPGEQIKKLQAYIRQLQKAVTYVLFSSTFNQLSWKHIKNNIGERK